MVGWTFTQQSSNTGKTQLHLLLIVASLTTAQKEKCTLAHERGSDFSI